MPGIDFEKVYTHRARFAGEYLPKTGNTRRRDHHREPVQMSPCQICRFDNPGLSSVTVQG